MKLQDNFQPDIPSKAVSTLLEILVSCIDREVLLKVLVSTLLEILGYGLAMYYVEPIARLFQPFLRFWGLCVRFLWVFKFFFGFL
jgi:CBS domain containing-hemolysin-like protein